VNAVEPERSVSLTKVDVRCAIGKKLFGKEQFDMMQEHAIYISTCRGPVTDEQALIDALNSGSIYGAGLDVLDPDPSPDSPLLDMENVIVLPHVRSFRRYSLQAELIDRAFAPPLHPYVCDRLCVVSILSCWWNRRWHQ
jgi:hypothetical protein